jgi:hypothetical protein
MAMSTEDFKDYLEEISFNQDVTIQLESYWYREDNLKKLEALAETIRNHKTLRKLRLENGNVSNPIYSNPIYLEAIKNPSIRALELSGCVMSENEAELFSSGIKQNKTLTTFTFQSLLVRIKDNNFSILSNPHFIDALKSNQSIKILGGSRAGLPLLDLNDAKALGEIIKVNATITEVQILHCEPKGLEHIFSGLLKNITVKKLALFNRGSTDLLMAVATGIRRNMPLSEIILDDTFGQNTNTIIEMGRNIGLAGMIIPLRVVKAIADGLKDNTNLLRLTLPPVGLAAKEARDTILKLLQRNNELARNAENKENAELMNQARVAGALNNPGPLLLSKPAEGQAKPEDDKAGIQRKIDEHERELLRLRAQLGEFEVNNKRNDSPPGGLALK